MDRKYAIPTFALVLLLALVAVAPRDASAQTGPYQYYAVTPCRVADTRSASYNSGSYLNGPPSIVGDGTGAATRAFFVKGGTCGIPNTAKAVSVNATVVNPTISGPGNGFLSLWPGGVAWPGISTINFPPGAGATANGAVVPLSSCTAPCGDMNVRYGAVPSGTLDFVLDVTGYFQ
jgi:hypothetical protein